MATLIRSHGGAAAVLVPARPSRRRAHGAPPGAPPDDEGGGGGDGDGHAGVPASGAEGVGPFALGLALIGITTLFAVLIAVWLFLRRPAPDWRAADAAGAPDALWISTACLLASSVTVELAARLGRRETRRRAARRCLCASLVLGLAFLTAQVQLWVALWRAGLVPAASGYAAVFFALTGLHALHVLGGLGFLGFLARRMRAATAPNASVRLGAVYWHYMGAIWLVLFTLLYFVR